MRQPKIQNDICITPRLLNSCWCEVGKVRGRKTWLSIGNGCEYKHVMTHELGHAIGFWHEQSRPDRDNYLKIHWENIQDSKLSMSLASIKLSQYLLQTSVSEQGKFQ